MFGQVYQKAALAELMSKEQHDQLLKLYDPTNNLAIAKAQADAAGDYPGIKTVSNTNGIMDSVAQGIGAGVNNFMSVRGYKQKQQAYQNVANAYQQAQAQQRELVLGQIAADQQRRQRAVGVLPEQVRGIYGVLDPTSQNTMLGNAATKEVGVAYTPKEAIAKEVGARQVRQMQGQEYGDAPMEVGGIPIPSRINQYQQIYGNAPVTTVDVNKGILANQGALITNQKAGNELSVQPQQLQQEIQAKALDIQIKQVEAQFAEQEKILQIKRDQLANQKGTLDYKKGLEEYKRFEQGQMLFKSLQDSGALNTQDPNKQAEIQAQLGINGIKWNPPNAKYSTIKHKGGAVYQVDNTNNMVRELINKGGKPSYGPWQELSQ